jgi:hypothetical protein
MAGPPSVHGGVEAVREVQGAQGAAGKVGEVVEKAVDKLT